MCRVFGRDGRLAWRRFECDAGSECSCVALHKKTEENQVEPENFACIRAPRPLSYPMPTKEVLSRLMLEGSDHHAPIKSQTVVRRLTTHFPVPKQAGSKSDNEFVQAWDGGVTSPTAVCRRR